MIGLEEPTRGQIKLGAKISLLQPGDRNMAMVFQSYALYPHMNVYENLASGQAEKNSKSRNRTASCRSSRSFRIRRLNEP